MSVVTLACQAPAQPSLAQATLPSAPFQEPCRTTEQVATKDFYYQPARTRALDPLKAVTQLDVDDKEYVGALNAHLHTSVVPLQVPVPDSEVLKQIEDANSSLMKLAAVAKLDEYLLKKNQLYQPLESMLLARVPKPDFIDERGVGGIRFDDLLDPRDQKIPFPYFTDLRALPDACKTQRVKASRDQRLRVYSNIELSQAYTEKVCLGTGDSVSVETAGLESTVDTAVHVWDPVALRVVATNDDAVLGGRASQLSYINRASARCVSVIVVNQLPAVAGRARVVTVQSIAGVAKRSEFDVQLRTFPQALRYAADDLDFEVALTRYTELPQTPTVLPLALFAGSELVGFDYDSAVGPASKVTRSQLGARHPTRAIVLGRSVEARDLTATPSPGGGPSDGLRPVDPRLIEQLQDDSPYFDKLSGLKLRPLVTIKAPPIGFEPRAPAGRVDLILDGPVGKRDGDADGISAETEAQLCTCDPVNRDSLSDAWFGWCAERAAQAGTSAPDEWRWFADTDHDGLTDREEVFGVELDQDPAAYAEPEAVFHTIALPLMGAEPLHKDMFIELDFTSKAGHWDPHTMQSAAFRYVGESSGLPDGERVFRGEFFDTLSKLYGEGSRSDLRNPDGLGGIRVHVDVGANPILTATGRTEHCNYVCGTETSCQTQCSASVYREGILSRRKVFGNWGGGGTRVPESAGDLSTPEGVASQARLCEIWDDAAHCPAGPTKEPFGLREIASEANTFSNRHRLRYFRYGITSPYGSGGGQAWWRAFGSGLGAYVVAHETGHTLGLSHAGHSRWGDMNCKPHYLSQMNYAYNYNPRIGFSSADDATSTVLDPANHQEIDFRVAGLDSTALSLLEYSPFRFDVDPSRLDAQGNGLANIDWNLSQSFDPGATRGPATWCPWPGEATKINQQSLMRRPDSEAARGGATPDLVRVGRRMYTFFINQSGALRYRQALLGPKSLGSCNSQRLGEDCLTWATEESFPTERRVMAVSVTRWQEQLVVAYTERTVGLALDVCEQKVRISKDFAASGSVLGWRLLSSGRRVKCSDIELATLPVDASVAAGGKLLSVFAVSPEGELTWSKSSNLSTWSSEPARDDADAVFTAALAPAVAVWPASDVDSLESAEWTARATACGVFSSWRTDGSGTTHLSGELYCFDRATARWRRNTRVRRFDTSEKPTLAFHILRKSNGEPLDVSLLPGQFWIGYVEEGPTLERVAWIKLSTLINRDTPLTGSSGFSTWFNGRHGNFWDYTTPGSGIQLYEDLGLGALKGVSNGFYEYFFQPFVDGSFQADLRTGNDFQVMEAGLCRTLRSGEPYCQGPEQTPFRY